MAGMMRVGALSLLGAWPPVMCGCAAPQEARTAEPEPVVVTSTVPITVVPLRVTASERGVLITYQVTSPVETRVDQLDLFVFVASADFTTLQGSPVEGDAPRGTFSLVPRGVSFMVVPAHTPVIGVCRPFWSMRPTDVTSVRLRMENKPSETQFVEFDGEVEFRWVELPEDE